MQYPLIDMQEAARRTHIKGGARGLYTLLKKHSKFNRNNTPKFGLKHAGYFIVEFKRIITSGGFPRQYAKTLVTPAGMRWLQTFVDEHGEKKAPGRPRKQSQSFNLSLTR